MPLREYHLNIFDGRTKERLGGVEIDARSETEAIKKASIYAERKYPGKRAHVKIYASTDAS